MSLTKCSACGATVSQAAAACPSCGHPLKKPPQHFGCGTLLALGFAAFAIMIAVESCSPSSSVNRPTPTPTPTSEPAATPEAQEAMRQRVAEVLKVAAGTWRYSVNNDDMSGRPIYSALLTSRNSFELDFPYQDPQHATLQLRQHPKHGTDVIISLERGQILCSFDGCRHDVRFDENNAVAWTMLEPESNESDHVFVRDARSFISKMRESDLLRVQLKLYDEAPVTLEFDVSQFDNDRWQGRSSEPSQAAEGPGTSEGRS
jgi:hypothetical protein